MLLGVDIAGRIAAFDEQPAGAAHSMDTDWYAVDRTGQVAQLWSGEEGAVPWLAHRQYWTELYEDLAIARIETLTADPRPEPRIFVVEPELRMIAARELPGSWNGIVQFANRDYLEMFRAEHYHDEWRDLDVLRDAVSLRAILKPAFDDYWNAGAIRNAYLIDKPVSPRAIGIYEYSCGFSGPYRRTAIPSTPVLLDALPERLRAKLGALRIATLSFDTTPELDPDRWFKCNHWS